MTSRFEQWAFSIVIAGLPVFLLNLNVYVAIASILAAFLALLYLRYEIRSFLVLGILYVAVTLFFNSPKLEELGYIYLLLGVVGIKVEERLKREKVEMTQGKIISSIKGKKILTYLSWGFLILSLPFMLDVWYYAFFGSLLKNYFVVIAFGLFALGFLLRTLEED